MSWELIAGIVVAFLTGGVGGTLIKILRDYLKHKYDPTDPKEVIRKVLRREQAINASLERAVNRTSAVRACVCVAENGGKIPRLGSLLTSSVVQACNGPEVESIDKAWQKEKLTPWYVEQLVECDTRGFSIGTTQSIPEGEPLRYIFEAQEIKTFRAYGVYSTEGSFFYMVFHFLHDKKLSANEENELRMCLSQVRTQYREFYKSI